MINNTFFTSHINNVHAKCKFTGLPLANDGYYYKVSLLDSYKPICTQSLASLYIVQYCEDNLSANAMQRKHMAGVHV